MRDQACSSDNGALNERRMSLSDKQLSLSEQNSKQFWIFPDEIFSGFSLILCDLFICWSFDFDLFSFNFSILFFIHFSLTSLYLHHAHDPYDGERTFILLLITHKSKNTETFFRFLLCKSIFFTFLFLKIKFSFLNFFYHFSALNHYFAVLLSKRWTWIKKLRNFACQSIFNKTINTNLSRNLWRFFFVFFPFLRFHNNFVWSSRVKIICIDRDLHGNIQNSLVSPITKLIYGLIFTRSLRITNWERKANEKRKRKTREKRNAIFKIVNVFVWWKILRENCKRKRAYFTLFFSKHGNSNFNWQFL